LTLNLLKNILSPDIDSVIVFLAFCYISKPPLVGYCTLHQISKKWRRIEVSRKACDVRKVLLRYVRPRN
jgi:hypothetical protein